MLVDVEITVSAERITISIPALNLSEMVSNQLICSSPEEVILDVGRTLNNIPVDIVAEWQEHYGEITSHRIYDDSKMNSKFVYTLVPIAIKKVQNEYKGFVLSRLYKELSDRFNFHLTLPDYKFQLDRQRSEFEGFALHYRQISELWINDKRIELTSDNVEIRKNVRSITTYGLMLFAFIMASLGSTIIIGLMNLVAGYLPENLLRFPAWLAMMIAVAFLGFVLSLVLWIIIAKFIWPTSYIHSFIEGVCPPYIKPFVSRVLLIFIRDVE